MQTVTPTPHDAPTPDLAAINARQRVAWCSGNCAVSGTTLQIAGEAFCEAPDLSAGQRVSGAGGAGAGYIY